MIIRARLVVTMDGPPIEDGAVRVRGERIIEVGKFSDLAGTDEIVDLGEHILLPGLINAHCHLDYTCLRGKIPPPPIVRRLDSRYQCGKGQAFGRRLRRFDQPRFCRSETIWNNHHREPDRVSRTNCENR